MINFLAFLFKLITTSIFKSYLKISLIILLQASQRKSVQTPVEVRSGAPRILPATRARQGQLSAPEFLPDGLSLPLQRQDRVPDDHHQSQPAQRSI